jgi:ring-1,2-phenylacetyl-CoA epoxidase subunit PaaE
MVTVVTPHFHRLAVARVQRETPEAISVVFAVPEDLADAYRYTQGQHLTLRAQLNGEEIRRSYSICSGVDDGALRIAIKQVDGGHFSAWANSSLLPGMELDVMAPDGRFFTPLDSGNHKHYVAFAAGSGITPVLSLIKTTLKREPQSRYTLVYGNRTVASILFGEELEDLKDKYMDRFTLHHVLSREPQDVPLFSGRIDAQKCQALLETILPADGIDEAFICGPGAMLDGVRGTLIAAGVEATHIHVERFATPGGFRGADRTAAPPALMADDAPSAEVVVIADGMTRTLRVPFAGASILDSALAAGADLPFACKGGVCCTCRARILEGQVAMDKNYSLEPHELERGFVLSCQSHPVSGRVVISYDERL